VSATDLVVRSTRNPILTPDDVPYPVATVHNAAAARLDDGRTVLVFRSHTATGRSILGIAESTDGERFVVRPEPFLTPATDEPFEAYERFGVEDPRVTRLDDGRWYLTYSAYSAHGVRIGLARTDDFVTVERVGLITEPDHRNVVLFPERIDGEYVRLDRPHTELTPWSIWLSRSADLVHWGRAERLIAPVTYHWTSAKVGPGAPPIRTDAGWLNIFHGVYPTMGGHVYRLGVALHDLADPAHVLGVADPWILEPRDPWERTGYVPNVVFTCGALAEDGGATVRLYWGAADTVMCTGTAATDALVGLCRDQARPPLP
jgi:predicted GH43/DUF377 family glycosyl hydrolase